jgi:hypothetical protein
VAGGPAPLSGPGIAPASPKNGTMLEITFEAEPVTGPTLAAPTLTNTLEHIYINNWGDVNEVTLAQFTGPGHNACSGLSTSLDIKFTADHELMAAWSLGISSAALPGGLAVASGTVPRGAVGGVPVGVAPPLHIDISAWDPCSYTLSLTTRRKVTDGENEDPGRNNPVTFCKD